MNLKQDIKFTGTFSLEIDGNADISIIPATNFCGFQLSTDVPDNDIDFNLGVDNLRIVDKNRNERVKSDFTHTKIAAEKKSGIASVLMGFVADMTNIAHNNKKYGSIMLKLFVPNLETLKLDIENGQLSIGGGDCNIKNLILNSSNLKLKLHHNFSTQNMNIDVDNLTADLYLSSDLKKASIVSDNAKIKIDKSDFKGNINARGDNIRILGNTHGDLSLGNCDIDLDNGKINIIN